VSESCSVEFHRLALAAFAARPLPKVRTAYRIPINSLDFKWEWSCPKCSKRFSGHSKNEVEVEARLHEHSRGPSQPWAPRYKMPPRYGRGLTR
jgi:hypothetical protein